MPEQAGSPLPRIILPSRARKYLMMIEREMIRVRIEINWTPNPHADATANSVPTASDSRFLHQSGYVIFWLIVAIAARLCTLAL
jgi:hypothetical protein